MRNLTPMSPRDKDRRETSQVSQPRRFADGHGERAGCHQQPARSPVCSSSPISATAQDRANIRGVEESGRPRDPHKVEIAGSNPAPATSTQPDEGSAERLPAICSGGNGGATGAPAEPASSSDPLTDPHPGDRVQVRSGLVAEVRGRLGETVSYAYADREGTHYAVAALSAWRSLCAGGKALAPEIQPGDAFDAVEVVR